MIRKKHHSIDYIRYREAFVANITHIVKQGNRERSDGYIYKHNDSVEIYVLYATILWPIWWHLRTYATY